MPTSATSTTAPGWYQANKYVDLPDDCRAKCEICRGHGSPDFSEVLECHQCHHDPTRYDGVAIMPCKVHRCRQCGGSGAVCPKCRGMRFTRDLAWNNGAGAHQNVRELIRCDGCCEGNNINVDREHATIERYLLRYRTWMAEAAARGEPFTEPRKAKQDAADAAVREQQTRFAESMQGRVRERVRRNIRHAQEHEQVSRSVTRDKHDNGGGAMLGQLLRGVQPPDTPRERLRQQTIQRATREDGE